MNSSRSSSSDWRMLLACLLLVAVTMPAQTPQEATQNSVTNQNATAPYSPEAPQYELKLPVPLVIEDVVVLDGKGKPVHGLKASNFMIKENGKPVEVRNFEEHIAAGVPTGGATTSTKLPQLSANIFTNVPQVPQSESLTILLLDALNTPSGDQIFVRQQMLKFANNLSPGAHVAIFGLSTKLSMLQGFTSDPEILRAALEQKRGQPENSPLRTDEVRSGPADTLNDAVSSWLIHNKPEIGMQVRGTHMQNMASDATFILRQRAVFTLQALNQLARYLSVLPGHKNLIWFSTAFPLNLTPNDMLSDPYSEMPDFRETVRETADMMARSRVAVYPVDARGIFADPSVPNPATGTNHWLEMHEAQIADQLSKHQEADKTYAERDTMEQVATATGGKAFFNTNGLKEAVDEVLDYGENYYTITYTPPTQKLDGKYRKIALAVGDTNLRASYRTGYFADDPNAPASGKKELPLNAMQTAMLHGVPDAIQVHFDAVFLPSEKATDKLTPGGHPDAKLLKPPYMSYTVQYVLDIRGVQFTEDANKVHRGSLELASYVYDYDGNPVNSTLSKVTLELPDDRFKQVAQQGMLTRQTIEAPVSGEYYMRVGIHDLSNDHVGALEVPLAKLKSLQELKAEAAKPDEPAK